MKFPAPLTLAVWMAAAVQAQTPAPPPEFEVASIRPASPPAPGQLGIGLHVDGAQIRCNYMSLVDYLDIAYRVRRYQVVGPDWLASDRFDVNAKLPAGAKRSEVPDMLQTLLADRFQIRMHREMRPLPIYALVVARGGIKIPENPPDPDAASSPQSDVDLTASGSRAGVTINLNKGSSFTIGNNSLVTKKLTMKQFGDMLSRFLDRPVIDMTGLKGTYDLTVELSPEDYRSMTIRSALAAGVSLPPQALRLLDDASESSLHAALQGLGLKLEPRKAPVEVLVIDHAGKTPTEN